MLQRSTALGADPQAKSEPATRCPQKCAGTGKKFSRCQDRFFLCCETAGQAKEKLPTVNFGMHREKETVRKSRCLFCSRCYSPGIAHPQSPLGVASRCERMRYLLSQYTVLCPSPLHCVPFCSATFRFGDRLWAGVLCFRVSDTPKQAHLPSLDPAATFRYSSRHSISLHSRSPSNSTTLRQTPRHYTPFRYVFPRDTSSGLYRSTFQ